MYANDRSSDPRSAGESTSAAASVPTIERKERYRLFRDFRQAVIALSGVFPLIPIFLMDMLPRPLGYVFLGAVLVGVPSLSALAYRYWPRRRKTLRVDEEGIHEVLKKGRLNTLRWDEIDRLETTPGQRTSWAVIPREPGRAPIRFDARLQDAHAVASLIRARLQGLPILPPGELPIPSREEIEAALGQPVPARWTSTMAPMILLGVLALLAGLAAFGLAAARSGGLPTAALPWVLLTALIAGILLPAIVLLKAPLRLLADEEGLKMRGALRVLSQIPWQEITGRDDTVIKGLRDEIELPINTQPFGGRLWPLLDQLLERRAQTAGMRLSEQPSAAALSVAHPETDAEPSAAALSEASDLDGRSRLTGRELEAGEEKETAVLRTED